MEHSIRLSKSQRKGDKRESGAIDRRETESYYEENVLMRNCQRKLGCEVGSDELVVPKPFLGHLRETLIVTPVTFERTSELNARTESL